MKKFVNYFGGLIVLTLAIGLVIMTVMDNLKGASKEMIDSSWLLFFTWAVVLFILALGLTAFLMRGFTSASSVTGGSVMANLGIFLAFLGLALMSIGHGTIKIYFAIPYLHLCKQQYWIWSGAFSILGVVLLLLLFGRLSLAARSSS